jgi:hypothetical protein
MAEATNIVEIPIQQPTGVNAAPSNPTPDVEGAQQTAPTANATPTPTAQPTSKGSGWEWILYFVLGLAFFVAIIYLISRFMGKGASSGTGEQKDKKGFLGGGRRSEERQQPRVETKTVYVQSGSGNVASTNPNAVAYMFYENAEVRKVQENLNNTCSHKIGKSIGVDGIIGNETLNAITKINSKGAEIAQQIRATRYVTREQMDWMLEPCSTKSSSNNTTNTTNSPVKDYSILNCSQIQELIRKHPNRDKSKDRIGGVSGRPIPNFDFWCSVSNVSLVEWLQALDNNKKTFFCRTCNTTGEYSTTTGNAT